MKPHDLGPTEAKHEEVLAAPHRYRLVVAGRESGYNTLLVEAAKRELGWGRNVLYLSPTDGMLEQERYYYFDGMDEMAMTSLENLHINTRPEWECAPKIADLTPDLVLIHEPMLFHWPVSRVLKNMRYLRRRNPAVRFLIAGIPYVQPNKSVDRCLWYRMERWSTTFPDAVGVWHWPSSDVYINRMKDYWDSYIINREMRAMWVELRNHGARIVEPARSAIPALSG